MFGIPNKKQMTFFLSRTDEGFELRGLGSF